MSRLLDSVYICGHGPTLMGCDADRSPSTDASPQAARCRPGRGGPALSPVHQLDELVQSGSELRLNPQTGLHQHQGDPRARASRHSCAGAGRRAGPRARPPRLATGDRQWPRIAIATGFERTHHRRRRQGSLSRLPPSSSRAPCTHRPVRPRDHTCHLPVQQTRSGTSWLSCSIASWLDQALNKRETAPPSAAPSTIGGRKTHPAATEVRCMPTCYRLSPGGICNHRRTPSRAQATPTTTIAASTRPGM